MEAFLSVSFIQREKGLLENRSLNAFCFFCTTQSAFGPFICGWKPRLTSTQTSNSGLDCCALKSCSDTGKILTRFFTMEEKTSCLATCQKFIAIKAPSCWCQQVNLWWPVDLGDGQRGLWSTFPAPAAAAQRALVPFTFHSRPQSLMHPAWQLLTTTHTHKEQTGAF